MVSLNNCRCRIVNGDHLLRGPVICLRAGNGKLPQSGGSQHNRNQQRHRDTAQNDTVTSVSSAATGENVLRLERCELRLFGGGFSLRLLGFSKIDVLEWDPEIFKRISDLIPDAGEDDA